MFFAAILLWILVRFDYIQVGLLGRLVKRPYLVLVLICLLGLTFPICALRWYILLKIQGINLRYFQVFKVNYQSTFLGLFLPGAIGGDAIRIALGSTLLPKQKMVLALSIFFDRLIGAISLLSLTIIATLIFLAENITYYGKNIPFLSIGIFITVSLITIFFAKRFPVRLRNITRTRNWHKGNFIQRLIANITESIHLYRSCPGQLALCYGISLIVHASRLLVIYILAISLGMAGVNVLTYVLAGSISFFANLMPATPGGIGIGEAAFTKIVGSLAMADRQTAYGTVILAIRALDAVILFPAVMMKFEKVRHNFFKLVTK